MTKKKRKKRKIPNRTIRSYQKFLEAFKKYSHKFELPEELKSVENYVATKKYPFTCKNCGYVILRPPRDFINSFKKNQDIRCKGCEEGLNAINYKLRQLGLDKYIQVVDYKGNTNRTRLKLTCKHGTETYFYWSNFYDFYKRNKKYYEKLGYWIFPNICDKCKQEYLEKIKKLEWIEKFKTYESDNVKILWDECDYTNMYSKCVLYCKKHGRIETTWISLYNSDNKFACRQCYYDELRRRGYESRKLTVEKLQKILDNLHGARIILILENPELKITSNNIIKVKCLKHNYEYKTYVGNLLRGHKCKFCGIEESAYKQTLIKTYDELINLLNNELPVDILKQFHIPHDKNKFPIKYDGKVTVYCNKHGITVQRLESIRRGNYCPYCVKNSSTLETFVLKYLRELLSEDIIIERNKKVLGNKYEIDLYLPQYNLGIEVHGLRYHSLRPDNINNWSKLKRKHKLKADLAEKANITLLQIFENELEDTNKWEIWKSMIRHKLGLTSNKIYARKLRVVDLTDNVELVRNFLEENHLQGFIPYKYAYGLINDKTEDIMAILTLGNSRFNKDVNFELLRFSVKKDYTIPGAFTKLLKHVIKNLNITSLLTYADRRYTNRTNIYEKTDLFEFVGYTEPNYYYFKMNEKPIKLYSRLKSQKHKLDGILEYYDETLTEMENMILLNNYYAIYDAGNLKYRLKLNFGGKK